MGKKEQLTIGIKNADPNDIGFFTRDLYRMIDGEKIQSVEITKVKKSPHSIEAEITVFFAGYFAGKALDYSWEQVRPLIIKKLHNWKEKKKQTALRMLIDGAELK